MSPYTLLIGPKAARADIIAELRSGLLDGIDAHRSNGSPIASATQAAIREFGDPRDVAAAFAPELAAKEARRLALILVAAGPPIGLLWANAAHASDVSSRHASFWQWAVAPPVPFAAAALLIAILAATATIAVTGHLTRWLPVRARIAAVSAAAGGFGVAAADLAILALLASQLFTASTSLAAVPVTAAAIASITRLLVARGATRRCLATSPAPVRRRVRSGFRV